MNQATKTKLLGHIDAARSLVTRTKALAQLDSARAIVVAEPTVESAQTPLLIPGSGVVRFKDDFARPNLAPPWQYSTPDTYITQGDPTRDRFVLPNQTDGTRRYCRFRAEPNVQSIYDAGDGNGFTRSQIINKSYAYAEGERSVTYFDIRRFAAGFPRPLADGGGLTDYSQLCQLKSWGGDADYDFIDVVLGNDGIKSPVAGLAWPQVKIYFPGNQWRRLGIEALWTTGSGWYRLWFESDGQMVPVTDRYPARTLPFTGKVHPCFGLYHRMSTFQQPIQVDVANPTICSAA